MVIPEFVKNKIDVFWDDEFRYLDYTQEEFNDPASIEKWKSQGFAEKFTGHMCDMRKPQPSWNQKFIDYFSHKGWKDIGTSYYRMDAGTILPTHKDLYNRYVELHNLQGHEYWIFRAVIFLEDWKPGHYAEYGNNPMVSWQAGDYVSWRYDYPHMAANVGIEPRYTLQITGHL